MVLVVMVVKAVFVNNYWVDMVCFLFEIHCPRTKRTKFHINSLL
jgi:hypothetical protein